jgi:hypothetical protein
VGVPSYVRDPPSRAPLCTRERIQGKKKKKKKEMMRAAGCCRKEKKEKQKEKRRSRGERVRRREREKNRVFLIATSIRDWGFVCGPILMKF